MKTTKKDWLLQDITENDMLTTLTYFNKGIEDKEDINKFDMFWIEQLKTEVNNTIKRMKEFNKID